MKVEQRKNMARNIKQSRYEVNSEKHTNSKECIQLIPVQIRIISVSSEKLMKYQTNLIRFSILYVETGHLISLYANQVFLVMFIQFMVPGPNRFRQSGTCSVKINKIVGKNGKNALGRRVEGFNLKEGRLQEAK